MAREEKRKDVVIVGLGWTGAMLAIELADEGLEVLALERGADRDTVPDFQYPDVADKLRYGVRYGFMQKPKNSTITVRHGLGDTALPYRQLGSFLPGDGFAAARASAGTATTGAQWESNSDCAPTSRRSSARISSPAATRSRQPALAISRCRRWHKR